MNFNGSDGIHLQILTLVKELRANALVAEEEAETAVNGEVTSDTAGEEEYKAGQIDEQGYESKQDQQPGHEPSHMVTSTMTRDSVTQLLNPQATSFIPKAIAPTQQTRLRITANEFVPSFLATSRTQFQ